MEEKAVQGVLAEEVKMNQQETGSIFPKNAALAKAESALVSEATALLAANPEAAARHREAMDRTAARKLQDEANATEVEEDEAELQQKVVRLAELLRALCPWSRAATRIALRGMPRRPSATL